MHPITDIFAILGRVRLALVLLFGAIVVGTYGYHLIEGWSFFDGLYMTIITLGTIGYGETHPLSPTGRLFTMLFILGGVAIVTYAFSSLTAIRVEGQLSQALKRRRMEKDIAKLSGHFIPPSEGRRAPGDAGRLPPDLRAAPRDREVVRGPGRTPSPHGRGEGEGEQLRAQRRASGLREWHWG